MEVMDAMFKGAQEPAWLEKPVAGDLRAWQVIFLVLAGVLTLVIGVCCCIRFRVPRTKQQIEADYQRRIITKKFRQQLERIQNAQMDSLDLKAALDIVRADFKIDVEDANDKAEGQNISLISSDGSNAPGSEGGSDKTSRLLKESEQQAVNRPGGFGSRLIALVRLSKQQPPQDVIC